MFIKKSFFALSLFLLLLVPTRDFCVVKQPGLIKNLMVLDLVAFLIYCYGDKFCTDHGKGTVIIASDTSVKVAMSVSDEKPTSFEIAQSNKQE